MWSSLRYSPQILLSPAQSRLGAVRRGRAGRHRRRGSLLRSGLGGCHRDAGATTNASAIVGVYRTSPTPRRFFCTCLSKLPHTLLLQQGALRRSGRNFGEQTACQAEGSSRLPFLAFQDPEELGTDEPPDVSKSARDRPVPRGPRPGEKVRAAPSGTEYVPIFIGRSGEPFPAGVEIHALAPALELLARMGRPRFLRDPAPDAPRQSREVRRRRLV